MKRIINYIFFPNWELFRNYHAIWDITSDMFGRYEEHCYYKIYYSPVRNSLKLKVSGYKPKEHPSYHSDVIVEFEKLKKRINELYSNGCRK
jgi:hypothetical protein